MCKVLHFRSADDELRVHQLDYSYNLLFAITYLLPWGVGESWGWGWGWEGIGINKQVLILSTFQNTTLMAKGLLKHCTIIDTLLIIVK